MQSSPHQLSSLSVFFPAYNEAENLPQLLKHANTVVQQITTRYELIVVDDGSSDTTKEVVNVLSRKNPHIRLVSHDKNRGYGAALKTGIQESQYEWVFFTDADLQFDISEIALLLPYTETHAAIIGWRKNRAEGSSRARNAQLFKIYIDILFRLHVKDIDCAFKLFKTECLQSLPLESNGAFTTSEILYRLKKRGATFKEVPVSHFMRFKGNPTGAKISVIVRAFYESFMLYAKIKIDHTLGAFRRLQHSE